MIRPLLMAAAFILLPATAGAEGQERHLSATVPVSLTVLESATIGIRSQARGGPTLEARNDAGSTFAAGDVDFWIRDSRGERRYHDAVDLDRALQECARAGEHEVDLTLIF